MKKPLITIFLLCLSPFVFAKPSSEPEWVSDYKKVYPESIYISQKGVGDSAESAKSDAASAFSNYIRANVTSSLSVSETSVTEGKSSSGKTVLSEDVKVTSEGEYKGLEFTEPFHSKKEKKWYCVCFMNRKNAWKQLKPEIDMKKKSFEMSYENLETDYKYFLTENYFSILDSCEDAYRKGQELLSLLEYGRILNPEGEAAYSDDREKIASIPSMFANAKKNCSIYIVPSAPEFKMFDDAFSKALSEEGLIVSKNRKAANYTAEISVNDNVSGSEPFSICPEIHVEILNRNGRTVYTEQVSSSESVLGYTMETARKKIYPDLSDFLEYAVKERISFHF